jgi:hexosaminidase
MRPTVWGEAWALMGVALPKRTIVDFWRGGGVSARGLKNATAHGYDALWNVDRGLNVGSWYLDSMITTWDTMYVREPCTGLSEAECGRVLGGGGEMWGERVDPSDLEQTLWPRLAAIAERLWSPRAATSGKSAVDRARPRIETFRCRLLERGVAAAPVNNKNARSAPAGPGSCRQ